MLTREDEDRCFTVGRAPWAQMFLTEAEGSLTVATEEVPDIVGRPSMFYVRTRFLPTTWDH